MTSVDATAGSVSKGVFVFMGKKKVAKPDDYFKDDTGQDADLGRLQICEELWEVMDERIQILQSELNTKIFEDLVSYVKKAHENFTLGAALCGKRAVQEIPTAALITGVNMPDHSAMFGNLVTLIKRDVSPYVAVLKAKDCPNVKSIMLKAISQLMDTSDVLDEDDEEEDHVSKTKVRYTMSALYSWYETVTKRIASPKKRKSTGSQTPAAITLPPVVVVFEDLEGFPPTVLQDFVTICSNYMEKMPIVLVFGIATAVTAVHRLLPSSASSLLCLEKFQAPPPTEYLTQVINQVILTADFPFKLGGKVFSLLLDLFLYHDFSIVNFIRSFQLAVLEHFYSNAASVLCQRLPDAQTQVDQLNDTQLDQIRSLMSFRRFVEQRPAKEQISLLEDDDFCKNMLCRLLERLHQYHCCFFPLLRCLHVCTRRLPRYPLGKQIREVYTSCLASNISDTPDYKEAFGLLGSLCRDELVAMLDQCIEQLSAEHDEDLTHIKTNLAEYRLKFENIESLSQELNGDGDGDGDEETAEALPKKVDMFTLRQKLQQMEKKKKKMTVYEVCRSETIEYLESVFTKYLVSPLHLPLHEVLYYDNATDMRRHINGCPRATIQRALGDPYSYLQNAELKTDGDALLPNLPDLCIVYKLHLECGRLINLYDWLQAFVTIVCGGDDCEDTSYARTPDKSLQARFIRAVSELQFLGFVKPTKRKTDHVARLTWGGC